MGLSILYTVYMNRKGANKNFLCQEKILFLSQYKVYY